METKKWEDCPREDLNMIPQMIAKGYTPEFKQSDKQYERITPENVPHNAVSFVKDNLHLWKGYSWKTGTSYWIYAELIKGSFENHKDISTLNEFLSKYHNG